MLPNLPQELPPEQAPILQVLVVHSGVPEPTSIASSGILTPPTDIHRAHLCSRTMTVSLFLEAVPHSGQLKGGTDAVHRLDGPQEDLVGLGRKVFHRLVAHCAQSLGATVCEP